MYEADYEKVFSNTNSRWQAATCRYNRRFDYALFDRAIEGADIRRQNMLIDAAMALCGDPYHSFPIMPGGWNEAEMAFLAAFLKR